jgi:predicted Rossmann fold nucleotide-binding protein DprA/Smf involved in DNA uptake
MQTWSLIQHEQNWTGVGQQALLARPLTAFFSSRQCPGAAIRATMDWTLEQAKHGRPVVSGFHAPLEQSVLSVLLQARCPVVVVLARSVKGARLPAAHMTALEQGHMAVVSPAMRNQRLTQELAAQRNAWVAELAHQIVVGHASPGGQLAALCEHWQSAGRTVLHLT